MPQSDFRSMVAGLEGAGLSRAEIASAAGVSRVTVWRLANGANRDHLTTTVERVERLHERIVGGAGNGSINGTIMFHSKPGGRSGRALLG